MNDSTLQWRISSDPVPYPEAVAFMEHRVAAIRDGQAPDMVWLLEHPPLYTAGTSAGSGELLEPDRFPVYTTGRGGRYTYHGPGQRVAYVMLDLTRRSCDVRAYVHALEEWVIATLARFQVRGERREERVGIWVDRVVEGGSARREDKIAAIGVRIRRWVTYHGIAINVDPTLDHFTGIVPCGISGHGVTSLADLGLNVSMDSVDAVLQETFAQVFPLSPRAAINVAVHGDR